MLFFRVLQLVRDNHLLQVWRAGGGEGISPFLMPHHGRQVAGPALQCSHPSTPAISQFYCASWERFRTSLPSTTAGKGQDHLSCSHTFETSSPPMPRQGVGLALDNPQTPVWSQAAAQYRDVCLAFNGSRPSLLQGHRHGPWWQHGPGSYHGLRWHHWLLTAGCPSLPLSL